MSDQNARRALLAIVSHARAGALDRAWNDYVTGGFDRLTNDSAALSVKGRLLKDKALRASGPKRLKLLGEASAAYEQAAARVGATYPLVNAASLALLAGSEEKAHRLAREVLERIEANPEEPETPYWRGATQAEALLLLGHGEEARAALKKAVQLAPQAWEDHAATLRQFALILVAQNRSADWLDPIRPPRSLHFGGHMSFAPDRPRPKLVEEITSVIRKERIGFGYGALAAGADIIVAETLVACGAELHVVVPGGIEAFAERSVSPYGESWRGRFDVLIEKAETIRIVRPAGAAPDDATIGIADEIAMGAALMNGRRLQSGAIQLLILASADPKGASGRAQALWKSLGQQQAILATARERSGPVPGKQLPSGKRFRPLAILAIDAAVAPDDAAAIEAGLARMQAAIARKTTLALPAFLHRDRLILAFPGPAEALQAAKRLIAASSREQLLRIAGHYGAAATFADPFSGADRPAGTIVPIAEAVLDSTPPGAFCATGDFAAALAATAPSGPSAGLVGELDTADGGGPLELYSISLSAHL